jgi:hypothetical protein
MRQAFSRPAETRCSRCCGLADRTDKNLQDAVGLPLDEVEVPTLWSNILKVLLLCCCNRSFIIRSIPRLCSLTPV